MTATYRYEGWYDITLTTTFAGQFRVDGGEWLDIDGTIEVASDPVEIYSKSLTSRLTDPYSDAPDGTPQGDTDEPWVPERSADTEGPIDPDAGHHDHT